MANTAATRSPSRPLPHPRSKFSAAIPGAGEHVCPARRQGPTASRRRCAKPAVSSDAGFVLSDDHWKRRKRGRGGREAAPALLVDKLVQTSGTTPRLSTQNFDTRKLLFVSPALYAPWRTGFAATQVPVSIGETRLVHKNCAALLLLLFIYRTIKEKPEPQLLPTHAGETAAQNGRGAPAWARRARHHRIARQPREHVRNRVLAEIARPSTLRVRRCRVSVHRPSWPYGHAFLENATIFIAISDDEISARGTFCTKFLGNTGRCVKLGIVLAQLQGCPQKKALHAFCPRLRDSGTRAQCTGLESLQVRAALGKTRVVHRMCRALLLRLCIYREHKKKIEEQPGLGEPSAGCAGSACVCRSAASGAVNDRVTSG